MTRKRFGALLISSNAKTKALTSGSAIAPLPRKLGAHNADQIAFVNCMCGLPWSRTGSRQRPYSLIAILTNVAFDLPEKKEWDADRVKHCYASRSRSR